ncbi:lysylphosphatidylglycerol synthase transmembrane domain-containing protein [Gimesia panareensis]|uniref:lysylphosphatidylglycerol synthase transmembrane domain-containing protein n=1 Tax=Gimesia panareensis TaxID=2527978 RepID=UPI00118AF2B2|nr:lysylphosphatidylglycerol synthase domain-containing protein [Gimesia panareensis]QDU48377.1 hypothetical protein Pan110_06910 [Gimesia panareensis]
MSSDTPATPESRSLTRNIWKGIKWALLVLVLYFVWQQGAKLYREQGEALSGMEINPLWLLLSGACYILAWLPSVWFWRQLLLSSGEQVDFGPVARAYYCGHLGKYIPGKVTVLLIRATLLKDFGVRVSVAALTAAYETLAVMGVGLVVFLSLIPLVLNAEQLQQWPAWVQSVQARPWLVPGLFLIAVFVSLPLLSRLLNLFAKKFTKSEVDESEAGPPAAFSLKLLYLGVLMFLVSWMLHGLSLGMTLASINGTGLQWQEWPRWTAAVSAAYALGFLAIFAPAGLGVREGLISMILAGSALIGPVNAVVAALLIRIVSFASEILAAFVLYYSFGKSAQDRDDSVQAAADSQSIDSQ